MLAPAGRWHCRWPSVGRCLNIRSRNLNESLCCANVFISFAFADTNTGDPGKRPLKINPKKAHNCPSGWPVENVSAKCFIQAARNMRRRALPARHGHGWRGLVCQNVCHHNHPFRRSFLPWTRTALSRMRRRTERHHSPLSPRPLRLQHTRRPRRPRRRRQQTDGVNNGVAGACVRAYDAMRPTSYGGDGGVRRCRLVSSKIGSEW